MKKLFIYAVGICLLPAFTSCKDDREENKYTGINKIYLSAETPVITESENIPLTVNVDLTLTCEQDLVLNFELPDDKNGVRTADTYFRISTGLSGVDDLYTCYLSLEGR